MKTFLFILLFPLFVFSQTTTYYVFGDTSIGASSVPFTANYAYYYKVVVENTMILDSLIRVAKTTNANPQMRGALYANDESNGPGALIDTTNDIIGTTANNAIRFKYAQQKELSPGTYWIGFIHTGTSPYFARGAGGNDNFTNKARTFTDGFPDPAEGTFTFYDFSDIDMWIKGHYTIYSPTTETPKRKFGSYGVWGGW